MNAKYREKVSRVLFRSYRYAGSSGGVAYVDAWGAASYTKVTCVGARLVFRTRELALYAGKQFIDLYVKHIFDADIIKD